jgi:hypothetical protein
MSGNSTSNEPNANTFVDFARRIVSVPHSEIKAKLDAEREAKRKPKVSVSRARRVSSKKH